MVGYIIVTTITYKPKINYNVNNKIFQNVTEQVKKWHFLFIVHSTICWELRQFWQNLSIENKPLKTKKEKQRKQIVRSIWSGNENEELI